MIIISVATAAAESGYRKGWGIIAKGKFEEPRKTSSSSSSKTSSSKSTKSSSTKSTKSTSSAAKASTKAGKAASQSDGKKIGLLVGIIAIAAILIGVGVGFLYQGGYLFSSEETETDVLLEEEEPVEELENMTDYTDIYPNVYIGGLAVGGMSTEDALTALTAYVEAETTSTLQVDLSSGDTLTFEITETVSETSLQNLVTEAWNHGREGTAEEQAEALELAEGGEVYTVELNLTMMLDEDSLLAQAEAYAEELNQEVEQTVVAESATQLTDESWVLEVVKGVSGISVDAEALYAAVLAAVQAGDYTALEFEVEITSPDEPDYETIAETWNVEAVNASYDVETESVLEGTDGYSLSTETMAALLEAAAEGETVQVPITILTPEIDKATMEASLFADVLSSKSTAHTSNSGRTTNLTLACEAINGTVVQPGETFSFNDVVGERTAEKGYQAATVYAGDGTNDEQLGGGICQVASTIYYCTLYANLEVVERTEHMYRVEYIDYGIDATIYWGSLDYKFKNNTDYPIKIEANVSGGYVNITFYGTKTDDTYVVMEVEQTSTTPYDEVIVVDETKPVGYSEVTQTAYTGYTYVSYRCIYAADGTLISRTQEATSVHNKRDRIITVGPDAETTATEETVEETETVEEETPTEAESPTETDTSAETEPEPAPETGGSTESTTESAGDNETGSSAGTDSGQNMSDVMITE